MSEIKQQMDVYLSFLKDKSRLSPETVANYTHYLKRFVLFLKQSKVRSGAELRPETLLDYGSWLRRFIDPISKQKLASDTVNYHLIALRGFLRQRDRKGAGIINKKYLNLEKKQLLKPVLPDVFAIDDLLLAPSKFTESVLQRKRDSLLLALLFNMGLKVAKLSRLRIADIKDQGDAFVFKIGSQVYPISRQMQVLLKSYLQARKDKNPYLFISLDKARFKRLALTSLSSRSIQRLIAHYAKLSGVKQVVTPSLIRHYFAKNELKKSRNLSDLQNKIGYKSQVAFKRYLKNI